MDYNKYHTWIFDCDGIILDSNLIKTDAFYYSVLSYGEEAAQELKNHHQKYGGISRFKKFEYFFTNIQKTKKSEKEIETALNHYEKYVIEKLLSCQLCDGFLDLMYKIPRETKKVVVSGGKESELREVFKKRELDKFFDSVWGSPTPKIDILQDKIDGGFIELPAIFIGDSKYDYECAVETGIDFVFVAKYSEFEDWTEYFNNKEVLALIDNLGEL